jgi:hypothetical protein
MDGGEKLGRRVYFLNSKETEGGGEKIFVYVFRMFLHMASHTLNCSSKSSL